MEWYIKRVVVHIHQGLLYIYRLNLYHVIAVDKTQNNTLVVKFLTKHVNEFDQEIPQSLNSDQHMAL